MMEDEIDLRAYIEVLLRYWKWILGLALAAAVVAFGVSMLLPRTYVASAVVLVTSPRYQIQFDPRFGTEEQTPVYKALPSLAMSDGILQSVVEGYAPSDNSGIDPWTLTTLRGMAEATSEGDPSLVLLKVTSRSPRDAAAIANLWADTLVKRGSAIYGQSEEDVTFFEEQVLQVKDALDQAEAALIEFQARNQASIVSAQLDSLRQTQTDYLADQRVITYIIPDIQGLRAQLAEQTSGQSVSLADSITALFLQIKAFNAQASTQLQLQVQSSAALSDKSLPEQIAFLDDLVATLQAKSTEIEDRLAELEPQILAAQQKQQEISVESDQLTRARDLARETYVTLARKLDESRIAAQEDNGMLQVGSYASEPEKPAGPRRLISMAVAGMLGLMVGVFGAFFYEFWRRNGSKNATTGEQAGS
jgi:succinoglycan biosynthesis transport protein ExoP